MTIEEVTPGSAQQDAERVLGSPLLEVRRLRTYFDTQDGTVKAVDGVSFTVGDGRTLGVVGESGCGKSITALSILRLIGKPGRIVEGEILLNGRDLVKLPDDELSQIRGKDIGMIFQEPMTSLNPVLTCGDQISETIMAHERVSKSEAWTRAVAMLNAVGIPDAKRRAKEHPHQLSGGMRQRVMIAMALSTSPSLLIADEPTTALDVTIQAQILELMKVMRAREHMAIILITHDLGVVAEMADDAAVMYAGKIVEYSDATTVFERPHHPYTRGLLAAIPRLGERRRRLEVIHGVVPNPLNLPKGCLFKRRCPYAMPVCDTAPPYQEVGPNHLSRCWLTPDFEAPAVGAGATGEVAEEAARALGRPE